MGQAHATSSCMFDFEMAVVCGQTEELSSENSGTACLYTVPWVNKPPGL